MQIQQVMNRPGPASLEPGSGSSAPFEVGYFSLNALGLAATANQDTITALQAELTHYRQQLKSDFRYNGVDMSRTQFPLVVAYAITVHKSQLEGCSLDQGVIDISLKDFKLGLTYLFFLNNIPLLSLDATETSAEPKLNVLASLARSLLSVPSGSISSTARICLYKTH